MTATATAFAPRWSRCQGCGTLQYAKKLARNLEVCPECGEHNRLTAPQRIDQLVDPGSFRPLPVQVTSVDPLGFADSQPYPARLTRARATTGLGEAIMVGVASLGGRELVIAAMDFRFLGGSLGAGVGELVTLAAEEALRRRTPLLVVSASGGARMQEGCISLMQMAKTSQAIGCMRDAGLLTVSVVTDPTYGGVAASYASNCDVVVAESGARMGFAGPRVIQQTIRQQLPEGFQTAEFLLAHGQVDAVSQRRELRSWLARLLWATAPSDADTGEEHTGQPRHEALVRDPGRLERTDPAEVLGLARDVRRPTTLDYIGRLFDSFVELHGDRLFGDCPSVVTGFGRFEGNPVAVIGHQKGHSTSDLVARNFGMPRPEGYRKALRVMRLAARLSIPVISLVDTPGAYPGVDAEERGQALAIADNVVELTGLPTPVIAVVTGEGGSGGALALAVADRVLMLANSVYSVISPEGCSAILWGDAAAAPQAARALRITAPELLSLGIVDGVIPEPSGGTQLDHSQAARALRSALRESLAELSPLQDNPSGLVAMRRRRLRAVGSAAIDVASDGADQTRCGEVRPDV